MGSTPIAQLSPSLQTEQYMNAKHENRDYEYAVNHVHSICCLAGAPSYVDDLRADLRDNGVLVAVNDHDTARLFDWLMSVLSFQGIADRVAQDFIDRHGNVTWSAIEQILAASPSCPKLGGYWLFHDCRYHKSAGTCAEPDHITACPLPGHPGHARRSLRMQL
jgi:hypothetical protein